MAARRENPHCRAHSLLEGNKAIGHDANNNGQNEIGSGGNGGAIYSDGQSVMTGNTGGHWTSVAAGSTKNAGTAVGTNCHSLTIQNSTIQGVP